MAKQPQLPGSAGASLPAKDIVCRSPAQVDAIVPQDEFATEAIRHLALPTAVLDPIPVAITLR